MAPSNPATPSPHRFLQGERKFQPTGKVSNPSSALRKHILPPKVEESSAVQSSQFAPMPRFSSGRSRTLAQQQRSPSPKGLILASTLRGSTRYDDEVDDAGPELDGDEDDEMLDDVQLDPTYTNERHVFHHDVASRWTNDLALSPKRRRLSHDADSSSQAQTLDEALLPANSRLASSEVQHFTSSIAGPTQFLGSTETRTSSIPPFVRPPPQPIKQTEPLPEAFSPHRRGHKFVPGGLAATVQQWVLETGQAAIQSRKGQKYLHGEDYISKVRIDGEVQGNGPYAVNARLPTGEDVNLLLAGGREGRDPEVDELRKGCVVGIRAPMWEIEVRERVWMVGVDWRVVKNQ